MMGQGVELPGTLVPVAFMLETWLCQPVVIQGSRCSHSSDSSIRILCRCSLVPRFRSGWERGSGQGRTSGIAIGCSLLGVVLL